MPPATGGKRKRQGSSYQDFAQDDSQQRPSPHRPQNLRTAQQHDPRPQQGQYPHHSQQQGWNDSRNRGSIRNRGGRNAYVNQSQSNRNEARPPAGSQPREVGKIGGDLSGTGRPNTPSAASMAPKPEIAQQSNDPARMREATPEYPKAFYQYDHLTEDWTKEWAEKGRDEIVRQGREAVSNEDEVKLALLFGEVLRAGLDRTIEPRAAGETLKDILEHEHESAVQVEDAEDLHDKMDEEESFDASAVLVDCVSLLPASDTKRSSFLQILLATETPVSRLREALDLELLVRLGLVRDNDIFRKTFIRYQTNVLYRQANFNLLREETEGFSKLVTELFTLSATGHSSTQTAIQSFKRITAIIGTFDLDVGRTLDVILDVFAAVLVKQHRFFVKLLRHSTWWPQSSNATAAPLPRWVAESDEEDEDEPMTEDRGKKIEENAEFWEKVKSKGLSAWFELNGHESKASADVNSEDNSSWYTVTGLAPPAGNPEAAQILGFKLRFYASTARDAQDVLPVNLVHLVALLIKIGFISLKEIYPHLWPEDEAMDQVKAQQVKEKEARDLASRPGGGKNALMMAGALTDDTIPAPLPPRVKDLAAAKPGDPPAPTAVKEPDSPPNLPEINDQKVQLLRSLLLVGAIPEALFMIGRFPWLIDLFPDMAEYIHRILNHCIDGIYDNPLPHFPGLDLTQARHVVNNEQTNAAKGNVQYLEKPVPKFLRWPNMDSFDATENIQYKFYWESWAEHIPVCRNVDDLFSLCNSFLNLSGVKIGQDPSLMVKVVRVGMQSVKTDTSATNRQRWFELLKRLLVPALSLVRHNSAVVNEVFSLLKLFSVGERYKIYAEWYKGPTSRLPEISDAFTLATVETKDVLKRISKDNVRPMARALAKVATSSPGKVIEVATMQMESYANLIEVVIECTRYFTDLGYDVLIWFLTNALGASGRSRVQSDGMLVSKWLLALSTFIGKVFARYQILSPNPILQILSHKIQRGDAGDLVILESLITNMAGIPTNVTMSESQMLAAAKGPVLRALTLTRLEDKRHEKDKIRSTNRLLQALIEPNIIAPLLVGIAQERQKDIFGFAEEDAHTKLLSNVFDSHHQALTQFLDFLRSNLSVADFDRYVPNVISLIKDFGIDASIAFMITRHSVAAEIDAFEINKTKSKSKITKTQDSADLKLTAETKEPHDDAASKDQNVKLDNSESMDQLTLRSAIPEKRYSTHPSLQLLSKNITTLVPERVWTVMTQSFYVFFWIRSLGDIVSLDINRDIHRDEIQHQELELRKVDGAARKATTVSEQKAKADQKKVISDLIQSLQHERSACLDAGKYLLSQINAEKDLWFADSANQVERLNHTLLEQCFLPRMLISATDALYCFKLFKQLHSQPVKNFRTLKFIDTIFDAKRLTWTIFMCSEGEIKNLGLFLNEILQDLARWHSSSSIYVKEAVGSQKQLPGFATKLNEDVKTSEFLQFEDFRRLMQKWHSQLCTVFKGCFESQEYIRIRNGISLLSSVEKQFPVIAWMGQNMVKAMENLVKVNENRGDIKSAAQSAVAKLRRREKEWISPQSFSINKKLSNLSSQAMSKPASVAATTSKPLNAAAKEFSPSQNKPLTPPTATSDSAKPSDSKPSISASVAAEKAGITPEKTDKTLPNIDDAPTGTSKPAPPKPNTADNKTSGANATDIPLNERPDSKDTQSGVAKTEKLDINKTTARTTESLAQSKHAPTQRESSRNARQDEPRHSDRFGRPAGSDDPRHPSERLHDSYHDSRGSGPRYDGRDSAQVSGRSGDAQYTDSRNGENNARGFQNQRPYASEIQPGPRGMSDRARESRGMDPPSRPKSDRASGYGLDQDNRRRDSPRTSGQLTSSQPADDRMRSRRDDSQQDSRPADQSDRLQSSTAARQPSRINTTQPLAVSNANSQRPGDMSGVHPDRLASIQSPVGPDPSRLNSPHDRRQSARDSVNQSPVIPKSASGPLSGRLSGPANTSNAGNRQPLSNDVGSGPAPRPSERDDLRRPVESQPEPRQRQDRRFADINDVLQPSARPNTNQALDSRTRSTRATNPNPSQAGYGRRDDQQSLDTRSRLDPPLDSPARPRAPNGANTSRPRSPERGPDRRAPPARTAQRGRSPSPPRSARNDNAPPLPLPSAASGNRGGPPSGPPREPYPPQNYGRDLRDRGPRDDERDRDRAGPPRGDPRDRYDVGQGGGYNEGHSRGRESDYGRPTMHDDRGRLSGGWAGDRAPPHPRDDRGGYGPEDTGRYANPRKRGPDDREREYVDQKRNRRGG